MLELYAQCMGDSSKPGVIEKSVRILLKLSAKISAKVLAGSNTFLLLSKVCVLTPSFATNCISPQQQNVQISVLGSDNGPLLSSTLSLRSPLAFRHSES